MAADRLKAIHRSTLLLGILIAGLLIALWLPGELVSPLSGNFGGYYVAGYEHGWPFTWMRRTVHYDFSGPDDMFPDAPPYGVQPLCWDNWQVWLADDRVVTGWSLAGDAATWLALLMLAMAAWEWRLRHRRSWKSFTLSDALLITTTIGVVVGVSTAYRHGRSIEDDVVMTCYEVLQHNETSQASYTKAYIGPLWLRRLFGPDVLGGAFKRVEQLHIEEIDHDSLEALVPHLENMPYLTSLTLRPAYDPPVRASEVLRFDQLAGLSRLRYLTIPSKTLGKQSVAYLSKLTQLDEIAVPAYAWDLEASATLVRVQGVLPSCRVVERSTFRGSNEAWWWGEPFP